MAGKPSTVRRDREERPALEAVGDTSKFDRLVHERLRLGILSALAVNQSLTFGELKKLLDASDGNLSIHARKLEEAGYVDCTKSFAGRMPRTDYRMTAAGGRGLPRIMGHRAGVEAARRAVEAAPDAGIGILTLFAFSSDNWRRPLAEVDALMRLMAAYRSEEHTSELQS